MYFFFSSRRRHTRLQGDWSSDVCSSDLRQLVRIDVVERLRVTHRSELVRELVQASQSAQLRECSLQRELFRSEERRVGKERGYGGGTEGEPQKDERERREH